MYIYLLAKPGAFPPPWAFWALSHPTFLAARLSEPAKFDRFNNVYFLDKIPDYFFSNSDLSDWLDSRGEFFFQRLIASFNYTVQ